VLCVPATRDGALLQIGAALATGNQILLQSIAQGDLIDRMPAELAARISHVADWRQAEPAQAVLFEGDSDRWCGCRGYRARRWRRVQSMRWSGCCRNARSPITWLRLEEMRV
jgi:delta 1-pyrroline-5-carboxylate dehydrogenase